MGGYLLGDIYNIAKRVKEIDKDLRIVFDAQAGIYRVYRGDYQVMTVPAGQLDQRVLMALHEGDLHRYTRLEDFIEAMEARELEHESKQARDCGNNIEAATMDKYDKLAGISHFNAGGIGG